LDYQDIGFPSELAVDKANDFEVEMALHDELGVAKTFLGVRIIEIIEHLTLRVVLPPEQPPRKVEFRRYSAPHELNEPIVEMGKMDRVTGEIRYDIKNPPLQSRYDIAWAWGKEPLPKPPIHTTNSIPADNERDTSKEQKPLPVPHTRT
jgi:hypothetical protein